jgi:hypothetical protein
MQNQLRAFSFSSAPNEQPRLRLVDVEVSVRPELLVSAINRGQEQRGATVLRLTQDDADTDPARTKRRDMGLYVATFVRLHVDQNLPGDIPVSNRLCMSIDVQHGELFQAPDANTRRMNDVENACRFIAAIWDQI